MEPSTQLLPRDSSGMKWRRGDSETYSGSKTTIEDLDRQASAVFQRPYVIWSNVGRYGKCRLYDRPTINDEVVAKAGGQHKNYAKARKAVWRTYLKETPSCLSSMDRAVVQVEFAPDLVNAFASTRFSGSVNFWYTVTNVDLAQGYRTFDCLTGWFSPVNAVVRKIDGDAIEPEDGELPDWVFLPPRRFVV
ncbi:MAG: hypothetical protein M1833_004394 [Piccolia ochrophora]|nr:MAG: hypothetical protein M1833_004394 [Piccolia ochrophora]